MKASLLFPLILPIFLMMLGMTVPHSEIHPVVRSPNVTASQGATSRLPEQIVPVRRTAR
jgi:hypothetical protein